MTDATAGFNSFFSPSSGLHSHNLKRELNVRIAFYKPCFMRQYVVRDHNQIATFQTKETEELSGNGDNIRGSRAQPLQPLFFFFFFYLKLTHGNVILTNVQMFIGFISLGFNDLWRLV